MDVQSLLLYIFGTVSTLYVLHFGLYLVGANLYDIWQFRRQYELGEGSPKDQPLVSVLISAHNEEQVITRSLDSINASSYKNIEVFVVDDGSTDKTYKIVRRYMYDHPEMPLQVIRKRHNVGKGPALNAALERHANGELAMTLDADSILLHNTIQNAVSYFEDPSIAGVAANVQIIDEYTVLGVLQRFEHMIGYRSKKAYTIANCEFVIGGVASTYRMSVLREVGFYDTDTMTEDIGLSMKIISSGNKSRRILYAANVVAMTEGVATFRALVRQRYRWKYGSFQNLIKHSHMIVTGDRRFSASLSFYRMPMAVISEFVLLLAPLIWGYVIYMTLSQLSLRLVVGAYVTITAYMLVTIWFDEHSSIAHRLHLSLYAPLAYFIFYIMDLVQVIAIVRCLYHGRNLMAKQALGGAWVSPERIGREVAQG